MKTLLTAPGVRQEHVLLAREASNRVVDNILPGGIDEVAGPQPFEWDIPSIKWGLLKPFEPYFTSELGVGLRPGPFAAALLEAFGLELDRYCWLLPLVDLGEIGRNLVEDYFTERRTRPFGPVDQHGYGIMRFNASIWLNQVGLYPFTQKHVLLSPEHRVRFYQRVMTEGIRVGFGHGAMLSWRERSVCLPGEAAVLQNICDRGCGYRFRMAFALPAVAASAAPQAEGVLHEIGELTGLAYHLRNEATLLSAIQRQPQPELLDAYRAHQPALSIQVAVTTSGPFQRDLWELAVRRALGGDTGLLVQQVSTRPDLAGAVNGLAHDFCQQAMRLADSPFLPEAVAEQVAGWVQWLDAISEWPEEWV